MGSSLPPFGIRHLRPPEPFSVLQINEQQYDTIVSRYPYTTLSFVDEDDGENVTVGSSFELKQRLEESPSHSAPSVHCYNLDKNDFEDRLIHLFDIQKTPSCRSLWKEQRINYNTRKRQYEKALNDKHERESISTIDLNHDGQDRDNTDIVSETKQSLSEERAGTPSQAIQSVNLSDALPDLVDNLATLMQTTSDTLRKAAEKSRRTNTSAVEDVLTGVSNIITEIGGFGLSLLDNMSDKTASKPADQPGSKTEDSASRDAACDISTPSTPSEVTDSMATVNVADSAVSPLSNVGSAMKRTEPNEKTSSPDNSSCKFCSTCKLDCQKNLNPNGPCHNCGTLGDPCSFHPRIVEEASALPKIDSAAPVQDIPVVKDQSILDQDYVDADFSRRYPPLKLLQRAASFTSQCNRLAGSNEHDNNEFGLKRHNSWTRRYPYRPAPQVLNDDTQRRRDFARNCFPAQEYTPGLGAVEHKSPTEPRPSKNTTNNDELRKRSELPWQIQKVQNALRDVAGNSGTSNSTPQQSSISSKADIATASAPHAHQNRYSDPSTWPPGHPYHNITHLAAPAIHAHQNLAQAPSMRPPSHSHHDAAHQESKVPRSHADVAQEIAQRMMEAHIAQHESTVSKKTSLPGAWPEVLERQSHVDAPSAESSGAFFHRMMRDNPSRRQRHAPDTNERLTRHRSFVKQRSTNPFSELNRSNTVSVNANPASRLNQPFEPFYPVAAPASLKFKLPESHSVRHRNEVAKHAASRFSSKAAQHTALQRPFSPVWEEHFNQMERHHEKIGKLDKNGESSSMYSPPPRHMRSVPNFATFKMTTAGIRPKSISATAPVPTTDHHESPVRVEPVSGRDTSTQVPDEVFYPAITNQPSQTSGAIATSVSPTLPEQPPTSDPFDITPVDEPLRTPQTCPVITASPSDIQACLTTLLDMGYGVGDDNLKSRLHIYAEAAAGDITDAIDMIDEDRRAHFVQEVESERSKLSESQMRRARPSRE